jgi:hypothetical protein
MSEKTRQKKNHEDKNKNSRRMRAVTSDMDKKTSAKTTGRAGRVKRAHRIDSVRQGYSDYDDQT